MEHYTVGPTIGEGTFAVVFEATDNRTMRRVAIKRVRLGNFKDGMTRCALREVKALQELRHPNIIELQETFSHNSNVHLVLEFMESDLDTVIKDGSILLTPAHVKCYMQMLLSGIQFCHANRIIHRDLKPNNLLFSKDGSMKIADFGLARTFPPPDQYLTNQISNRWYRPPELLFGVRHYGSEVDMWAIGCIFAELMLRRTCFEGESDIDQLGKIFSALGTPTEESWPGVTQLPSYVAFTVMKATGLGSDVPPTALPLLSHLLHCDPCMRCTAQQALENPYFTTGESPIAISELPLPTPPERLPHNNIFGGGSLQPPAAAGISGGSGGGDGGGSASSESMSKVCKVLF